MKELNNLRNEIDNIDNQLMELLNKRFKITQKIGSEKIKNNQPIENLERENDIISKTYDYEEQTVLEKCFKQIISISKEQQMFSSYLLLKDASYTLSPLIHSLQGNDYYKAIEGTCLEEFISKKIPFKAVNISNPYKKDAFKYCLNNNIELDKYAKKTSIINLIINSGTLKAYNTDYLGFKYLIENNNISLKNKNIMLLGNGDTSSTIQKVLEEFQTNNVFVVARTIRNKNEISYTDAKNLKDIDIVINATSYGVMPNLELDPLIDLSNFNLECIIDVNYNPNRSALGINNKVKYVNGLDMLIEQARIAEEMIQNKPIDQINNEYVKKEVLNKTLNLCFIGMPFSGKTTFAQNLSAKTGKTFFDSDIILKDENLSLSKLLSLGFSVSDYREYEKSVIETLATLSNSIISTGGGIIEDIDNVNILKQKGLIIFIDTPLDILEKRIKNDRPLVKDKNDLKKLYEQRYDKYLNCSDIILDGSKDINQLILELEVKLNEYLNN